MTASADARRSLVVGLAMVLLVFCQSTLADMVATIERVKPSIVAVGTFAATSNPQFSFRGTGFVVGDGNLAATNAHVLPSSASGISLESLAFQVRANGQNQIRRARVLSISIEHDLAMLQFDGPALPALVLKDSDSVREGMLIGLTGFPIGNALGFSPVTHRGMVSAITPIALPGATSRQLNEKLVRRLRAGAFDILQLDATAYPGNSGSPVFDAGSGEVVGIINMVLIRGTREAALSQPTGISYAIPSNFLLELLNASR